MKTIRFNRSHSMLRSIEEDKVKRKKFNWDKLIYFVVLGLIIFFIAQFSIKKIFFVEAEGQMMINSLTIRVPSDITIGNFFTSEGDTVEEGDTLFSYNVADEFTPMPQILGLMSDSKSSSSSWEEREIYNLKKNKALNVSLIQEHTALVAWYRSEIESMENEVILEISSKNKIESYRNEIEKLELDIQTLRRKNAVFNTLIASLDAAPDETVSSINGDYIGGSGNPIEKHYMKSPVEGTVTRIFKTDHEVALKTEDIMNLHKREDIYIKAFFRQEDFKYVKEGDKVDIEFPDGSETQGIIKRFYFATYQIPPEFQKKYESLTRSIAADISPIDHEDELRWKTFHKMTITISKFKY